METLSPTNLALARHHSYLLLSRLYVEGLTAELLPFVEAIPELAAVLPYPFAADQAAADHYHLLVHTLFPYQSIFLEATGLVGGHARQALLNVYSRAGYTATAEPDHIGCELGYLAFLSAAEADAWERRETAVANHFRNLQQAFLQAHLLRWVVPLAVAIRQEGNPIYLALADLTLALVNDHFAELEQEEDKPVFALREPPALLDDPATRLRDVTRYLLAPPYSGIFLSRQVIGRIGRELNLPVGFGGREDLLATLLHTGGQYELAPDCLNALHKITGLWAEAYTAASAELPTLTPFIVPWQKRTEETAALLSQLSVQLERQIEFTG